MFIACFLTFLLVLRTLVRYNMGMAADTLTMIEAGLAQLAAEDIVGVSQRDVLTRLERARAQLDAETARRLAELDRQGEHRVLGYKSAAGFLIGRMRCAAFDAYRRVRVARHVDAMP